MRALYLACLVFSGCIVSYGGYDRDRSDHGDGYEPQSTQSQPGLISGRVVDAQTGRPVEGAFVSTDQSIGTVTTNSQGMFTLETYPLSGNLLVGVVADKPGFRQSQPSCVIAVPQDNASADVQLLSNSAVECASSCTDGSICLGGVCASACNPVCACNERCEEGRCVLDPSAPTATVTPPSGGSSTGGSCPPDTVTSATGCVAKPLLGDWTLRVDLDLDMDGQLGTFADRTQTSVVWQFTVYDVQLEQNGTWLGSFGNGRQVSVTGSRISGPDGQAQDRCSGQEELTGIMRLSPNGPLTVSSEYGTGLVVCARVDGGPSNEVLTLTRDRAISQNGFGTSIAITDGSWGENPTEIEVLQTSGEASITR